MMKTIQDLMLLAARVFLPLAAGLGGLGYVFVDAPSGFTAAVAAMTAVAACLVVVSWPPPRQRRGARLATARVATAQRES